MKALGPEGRPRPLLTHLPAAVAFGPVAAPGRACLQDARPGGEDRRGEEGDRRRRVRGRHVR